MVLLVAGDGPERQRLIDLSTDLGVSDRVFFLGHYAQVSALMRHLDIFALPTAGEGFGLVVPGGICVEHAGGGEQCAGPSRDRRP